MADIKKGDKVEWNSSGGKSIGDVEEILTEETVAAGRKVKASEDSPQALVKSDKSGKEAVHKLGSLKKQ